MSNALESQKIQLVCVSPVHIGSGEVYRPYEYLYDEENSKVAILDESKWIAFLAERGWMDEFSAYVDSAAREIGRSRGKRGVNLFQWLKRKGVSRREMQTFTLRSMQVTGDAKGSLNDVHIQTALADGRPYIPGSSIKGAMRIGILYGALQKHPDIRHRRWTEINGVIQNRYLKSGEVKRELSNIAKRLETEFLHTLKIRNEKRENAVCSAMRGLRVSDAVCDEHETILLRKLDVSTKPDRAKSFLKKLPIYRECIPAGRRLTFRLSWDPAMLATCGISGIKEIRKNMSDFMRCGLNVQKQVDAFSKYAPQFEEAEQADFFLGGGTGFFTKSLLLALAPSEREAKDAIQSYLDCQFYKHKHRSLDREISPRTLKLARDGGEEWLLGLVRWEDNRA